MRRNPIIYEINTWIWLADLSERFGKPLLLGDVPDEVIDELAAWRPDLVWAMGVWERSPRGREIALRHPDLQFEYGRVLPGFTPEQVVGSPYAVHRYVVDPRLGGKDGLAAFRAKLRERGIGLILDYVPNHVAVDHSWIVECPTCLVQGTEADLRQRSASYFRVPENGLIFAHGRDPYFPAWTDTAQVDAFSIDGRTRSLETVMEIASQCDGVRCDMAMLLVNRIFADVWKRPQEAVPATEFWQEIVGPVKTQFPEFIFMAEVYWDMEAELQSLGFDYTYDKRLYDRMRHESIHTIRDHLLAASAYQRKMVRFIENHDEPRAMTTFGPEKSRAAATIMSALPGAKLFYDGQFEGRHVRIPVQLGKRPHEHVVQGLPEFYRRLTNEIASNPYHDGTYMLLASHPILGSDIGHEYIFAFAWALGEDWRIVVVNYHDQPVKGRIMLPHPAFAGPTVWRFENVLTAADPVLHIGDDLLAAGLPLTLEPYATHIYAITRST